MPHIWWLTVLTFAFERPTVCNICPGFWLSQTPACGFGWICVNMFVFKFLVPPAHRNKPLMTSDARVRVFARVRPAREEEEPIVFLQILRFTGWCFHLLYSVYSFVLVFLSQFWERPSLLKGLWFHEPVPGFPDLTGWWSIHGVERSSHHKINMYFRSSAANLLKSIRQKIRHTHTGSLRHSHVLVCVCVFERVWSQGKDFKTAFVRRPEAS